MDVDRFQMLKFFQIQQMNIRFHLNIIGYQTNREINAVIVAMILALSLSSATFAQEDEAADPVAIFNQAQNAHEKGDFEAAVKLYDQALKIAPEFPEAEYQKGAALLSLNKSAEAEKSFRRALEWRADWTLPMASLGALLVRDGRFPEAEKLLIKAVETDEPNFAAFSALTDLRLQTHADNESLNQLLEKIKILTLKANPPASLWTSRGLLENHLGDRAAAKKSLARALALEPKNQAALLERAQIALIESDSMFAEDILKTLRQFAPNSINVKLLQAKILMLDDRQQEALNILKGIENPSAEVLTERDRIIINTSVNSAELEKQLEKDAKNPFVLGRLCSLLRLENPVRAMDYCRRAFEIEPSNINHAIGYGSALVQAKKFTEAAELFRRMSAVAPENATIHANLGISLFELKQFAAAKTEYLWLSEKQSDSAVAFYFLAICYDQLTEFADAMANYQQFLRLADAAKLQLEIDKVNLRLPALQKLIKENKGKKK